MGQFTKKVVVITGAAGNLGEAVVRRYMEEGANLILVDRAKDRLSKMYPKLVKTKNHWLANQIDATNEDAIAKMMSTGIEKFGKIDILVNTVGGFSAGVPLHETPIKTLDFMFNLNAKSLFIACKAVIPYMIIQEGGKIINVAARPGVKGMKNTAAYSAAKSAVIRLTESMSAELRTSGINVNCILPGTIDTPNNREEMPKANFNRWVKPAICPATT